MIEKINEIDGVRRTVQKYIDGIADNKPALIREAFHPDAAMSGHFPRPDGPPEGVFTMVPGAADVIVNHLESAPPISQSSPDFQGRVLGIDITGTMASVKITEQALEGRDFITHFHLHKVDGNWLITAKATYSEPG